MLREFKKFALRGNVLELAIGVIIGAAFGKIVTSLVEDIIMPPIGVVLSATQVENLEDWTFPLTRDPALIAKGHSLKEAKENKIATINYGRFVNNVVTFVIVSFSVFIVVKQINRFAPPVVKTRDCPECFSAISIKAKRCPNCTSTISPVAA